MLGGTLTSTIVVAKNPKATADTIHAALLFFKSARLTAKMILKLSRPTAGNNGQRFQHFGHNAILLARSEVREHGKRQHLRYSFLRHREITNTETKSFVGLREVKRDRIVNPCTNAGLFQMFLELCSIGNP